MSKNGYDFYLDKCLLPVAPNKLQIKIGNANETLTLISGGEINILKTPKLSEIEFECLIPQVKYPFANYKDGFQDAAYFLDYFEKLKTDMKPFQFIVSRTMPSGKPLFSTNITVAMEDYKITEQAKEGFDLTVKVKLKQYREYGTKTVSVKITGSGALSAAVEKQRSDTRNKRTGYRVGDIVDFHGGTHYCSSYEGSAGYPTRAGKAKIVIANGAGKAHPWALIHIDSVSNVYGWVDDGTFD